jgi:hypothetical protein
LQRKRADCGTASPVIAALCYLGGENANRQSEHERGRDSDYALGHHGSPLGFLGHVACIAVYSTAACDGCHKFGEYRFGFDEAHFAPPVIDGAVQSGFSAFLFLAAAPQIGPEKN